MWDVRRLVLKDMAVASTNVPKVAAISKGDQGNIQCMPRGRAVNGLAFT